MSQAEAIKQYLKVRDLQTKDTSAQEEEDDQRFLGECMHAVFNLTLNYANTYMIVQWVQ